MKGRIHVVTEGRKTERKYITAVRISLRIPKELVLILKHECTDPLSLIEQLITHMGTGEFDHELDEAWAVFDVDEHRHDSASRGRFEKAVQLARKNGIKIAASSPCIELWLLIHFDPQSAPIDRAEAAKKLKTYLPNYDKTLSDKELSSLLGVRPTAVANAEKLRKRAAQPEFGGEPFLNPTTQFHLLIERIVALK